MDQVLNCFTSWLITLSSDPFPALPAIAHWCCAPWNVAFLRILGFSCLLPICVRGCRTLRLWWHPFRFAQNYRPFSVSSGIEHGCGQFRGEPWFYLLKEIRLLPAGCPEGLLFYPWGGDSPGCVLILTLGCIWLFQVALSSCWIQGSLCPACCRCSAPGVCKVRRLYLVGERGPACCHWERGLGPTEAVSLPPPHSLLEVSPSQDPLAWNGPGDGDREEAETEKEAGFCLGVFPASHTFSCTLALRTPEGVSRRQPFLWRNPDLAQSLRRFVSAFNIIPHFYAFSTLQFVVVANAC